MVRAVVGLGRGDLLLRGSLPKLRTWIAECLAELCLGDVGYTAYSLRRGGASYFHKCTGDLARRLLRGRWENTKTARIYTSPKG